jgi:hypothetical protein
VVVTPESDGVGAEGELKREKTGHDRKFSYLTADHSSACIPHDRKYSRFGTNRCDTKTKCSDVSPSLSFLSPISFNRVARY